jgi:hypothetical protein
MFIKIVLLLQYKLSIQGMIYMKIRTKVVGPDLTDVNNITSLNQYLASIGQFTFELSNADEDYLQLLSLTGTDQELAKVWSTLKTREPVDLDLTDVIVKIPSAKLIENEIAKFEFRSGFKGPGYTHLELSLQKVEGQSRPKLQIDSFFPGYLSSGQTGIGRPLFNQVLQIANYHNCSSVYCLALDYILPFWEHIGLTRRIPVNNFFGEFYSSMDLV